MRYDELLKKDRGCPFCPQEMDKEQILFRGMFAHLLLCAAPYAKDHLIVIPKRHCDDPVKLSPIEWLSCWRLIKRGIRLLERKHQGYTLFVRDGWITGKTVEHLHFHLLPDLPLQAKHVSLKRRVLSTAEIRRRVEALLHS